MKQESIFTIDTTSDKDHYVIYRDGIRFAKASKRNSLDYLLKFYNATIMEVEHE